MKYIYFIIFFIAPPIQSSSSTKSLPIHNPIFKESSSGNICFLEWLAIKEAPPSSRAWVESFLPKESVHRIPAPTVTKEPQNDTMKCPLCSRNFKVNGLRNHLNWHRKWDAASTS